MWRLRPKNGKEIRQRLEFRSPDSQPRLLAYDSLDGLWKLVVYGGGGEGFHCHSLPASRLEE